MTETLVYLARHGEAETNVQPGMVAGLSLESPPTTKGLKQASTLGKHLKRINLLPQLVASSRAERAKQTARLALDTMGRKGQIAQEDDRLNEMSQGGWEGKERSSEYSTLARQGIEAEGIDFKITHPEGDGGSRRDVAEGMLSWLEEARSEAQTIFVVSHRVAITCLLAAIDGWPADAWGYDSFAKLTAPHGNTTVTGLQFKNRRWYTLFRARRPEELSRIA
ncbi:MAG TPA: histidine phosphatase family protein [Candidatus Saccharimonadales bacterium]